MLDKNDEINLHFGGCWPVKLQSYFFLSLLYKCFRLWKCLFVSVMSELYVSYA